MPQDSILYKGGDGSTIYNGSYESMPPELRHLIDSLNNNGGFDPTVTDPVGDTSMLALKITLIILLATWILVKVFRNNPLRLKTTDLNNSSSAETGKQWPVSLVYEGADLNFSATDLTAILVKRFPYFKRLSVGEQRRFLFRLQKFMRDKTFKIHDSGGFKEMPVLISAAAIQLSFGLEAYRLPDYPYINIFPKEFLRTTPHISFLEGNVSGNNIKISWKHFLSGYALPEDGKNVGLHEMAHAYYCQNFLCREDTDDGFIAAFPAFEAIAQEAFEKEKTNGEGLYSSHADRNFQEFWAESVELFFERSVELSRIHPALYTSMCRLLNQSPGGSGDQP